MDAIRESHEGLEKEWWPFKSRVWLLRLEMDEDCDQVIAWAPGIKIDDLEKRTQNHELVQDKFEDSSSGWLGGVSRMVEARWQRRPGVANRVEAGNDQREAMQ